MGSTSTLPLYSHPKISFPAQPLKRAREAVGGATSYCAPGVLFPATPPYISRRRCWRSKSLVVRSDGGPRRPASNRRVYKQSQSQAASFPVKEIASFIVPAGAFVAITFGDSSMEIGGENPSSKTTKFFVSGKQTFHTRNEVVLLSWHKFIIRFRCKG